MYCKENVGLRTFDHTPILHLAPSPATCSGRMSKLMAYICTTKRNAKCNLYLLPSIYPTSTWNSRVKPRMKNGHVVDLRRFEGFEVYINKGSKGKTYLRCSFASYRLLCVHVGAKCLTSKIPVATFRYQETSLVLVTIIYTTVNLDLLF